MALTNFHHNLADMDVDTERILYIRISQRGFYVIRSDGIYQTPSNIMCLASRNAHRPTHMLIDWFHATLRLIMHLLEQLDPGNLLKLTIRRSATGVFTWNLNISNDNTAGPDAG
ncbi:hypothetical protein QFC21_002520 [Naganishia friedmannii]|uniref:Uncharacterized protein n=2 Tax=Naganishia friedmannii TaxID=89922 RepID=A0ACC2V6R5_9TREE|nr:hypothetical protein QFC21_005826 [Naganishia friedmannii]KAJ9103098.1 hypothetical protein QFC21_002520 [Naganishia friedmannii]